MTLKGIQGRSTAAVAAMAVAIAAAAHGQDWAKARLDRSPRHGEYVTIHEPGGRNLQAWVVYPEVKGKAPVVVMIHEIFGLSDWAREMADEVAAEGYIVVEPDLLSGLGPGPGAPYAPVTPGGTSTFPDQSATVKAVSSLPDPQVLADLDAAADYGKHLPAASAKFAVAGFCWGGGKSFLFATHRHDLSAAFVFYGPPPATELLKDISAPVYGFYAGNDARITATVDPTKAAMKAAGKTYDPVIYNGAGHGFMRAGEAPAGAPTGGMAGQGGPSPETVAANTVARNQAFQRMTQLLRDAR